MNQDQETHRLFFALWPDDEVRQSIIRALDTVSPQVNGRIIQPHNLHITLHFIGQVSDQLKQSMHTAARSVASNRFAIDLDSFGSFSRARVFWMGSKVLPGDLVDLHNKLGDALSGCGFRADKRPYSPHVSLLRKCTGVDTEQPEFSIHWPVNEFVLVESVQEEASVNYRVLEQYPLS